MTLETTFSDDETPKAETEIGGGWRDLLAPRYLASTIMLCLGTALFAFNGFFVSVAMPSAVAELGRPWLLAWTFSLYLVFAIVGGAMAAYLKGRFGAAATLLGATIVFLVGTVLASLASHSSHLVIGRLLQGYGEGITIALCYALIPLLFPKALVPKVFGSEAIAWAAAAFGGPLIAGIMTQYISWRAAFASSLPAAVLFGLLVVILVPRQKTSDGAGAPVPLFRLAMIGVGIMATAVCGLMESRIGIALLLALAFVAIGLFIRADRRSRHAILPRHAFSPRVLPGTGLWVILLMPLAGSASAVYMIYGLQGIWGLKPASAGLASAVMALTWSFTAILVASVNAPDIRKRLIGFGPLLLATGLSGIVAAIKLELLWLVYPSQMVVGAGFGISWGTLSQLLMDSADSDDRDRTSALLPTLQSVGYAIGGAAFGLLANVAGLREGLGGEALREVLVPIFVAALGVAVVCMFFGWRTVFSSPAVPLQEDVSPQAK